MQQQLASRHPLALSSGHSLAYTHSTHTTDENASYVLEYCGNRVPKTTKLLALKGEARRGKKGGLTGYRMWLCSAIIYRMTVINISHAHAGSICGRIYVINKFNFSVGKYCTLLICFTDCAPRHNTGPIIVCRWSISSAGLGILGIKCHTWLAGWRKNKKVGDTSWGTAHGDIQKNQNICLH